MFIGRKQELSQLENLYHQDGFQIFVVGGSEGAGKTTLIEEFCKNKPAIFFTASQATGKANLLRFSNEILTHYDDLKHEPFMFWDSAFKYIRDMQDSIGEWASGSDTNKSGKIVVVFDDIELLANRDSVFVNMLRKCIDNELMNSRIFMIISSGDMKFLRSSFLERGAVLFHRMSGSVMLEKFTLSDDMVEQLKAQAAKTSTVMTGAKFRKFSADEVIIREGETHTEMYKIISGKALMYTGYETDNEYLLGTLKENRSFGEYSMLTGKAGFYTVTAFTDMLVLRISQEEFEQFISMNASNAVEIMKNMADMINLLSVNIDMLRKETEA